MEKKVEKDSFKASYDFYMKLLLLLWSAIYIAHGMSQSHIIYHQYHHQLLSSSELLWKRRHFRIWVPLTCKRFIKLIWHKLRSVQFCGKTTFHLGQTLWTYFENLPFTKLSQFQHETGKCLICYLNIRSRIFIVSFLLLNSCTKSSITCLVPWDNFKPGAVSNINIWLGNLLQ